MKLELYKREERFDNGKISDFRSVTVTIKEDNKLVFCCCDINKTVEQMFSDIGAEFFIVLDENNKDKLSRKLSKGLFGSKYKSDENLLSRINDKFSNKDSCFDDIKKYLNKKNIEFEFSRW